MGEGFEIRRATRAQRREIDVLWRALIAHHRALDPGYAVPPGLRAALHEQIDHALGRPDCGIWLAHAGGEAVGFALAEAGAASRAGDVEEASAWVHELWVEPGWRRHGVGSALVEHALAFLRERGVAAPAVRVEAANTDALRFWRAHGFRERAHVLVLDDAGVPAGAGRR